MTEKEAIKFQKAFSMMVDSEKGKEACEVAIKALEKVQEYGRFGILEEVRNAVEKRNGKKPLIGADFMIGRDDEGEPIWEHDYACPECGFGIAGEYILLPVLRNLYRLEW